MSAASDPSYGRCLACGGPCASDASLCECASDPAESMAQFMADEAGR